jgi:DNA-binding winged helix-turn-helix (wHTH) protein
MFSVEHEVSKMAPDTHRISDPAGTSIVFGPFRLSPMQRLLTEGGKPVRLGSRAFDILVALLERPGELVSKQELIARVWPSTFVASANLAVHISGLRRALRDGEGGNRYVVNIPGRGYRFVARVTVENDVPSAQAPTAPPPEQNLPVHAARPIGSSEIIDALRQKLQQNRLLTIGDPRGIDTTTVALAVVQGLIGVDDNGVWLVDLSRRGDA